MKTTWKLELAKSFVLPLALSPSVASFFSARYDATPNNTRIIGTMKNRLIIFSLACELNNATKSAPSERIAPGSFCN